MENTPETHVDSNVEMCTPLILVAEDNALNRRLTCDILKSRGYKVLEVANARMVVEAARQNKPDLVLVDMSQPELNALNIVQKLREDKKLDNIPVVAVTNAAFDENDTEIMCQQYDELISKPISIRILVSMVDDILARIRKYAER